MKTICFISQFPPPIHGLSKAVDTLYSSSLGRKYKFKKVDITDLKLIVVNLFLILFAKSDLYYFTIAQTRGGNLRDLLILALIRCKKAQCLVHLHGGYYRTLIENDCPAWQRILNYRAISKVNGCIVLGGTLKPIFKDLIDSQRIFTVPNCVDDQYVLSTSEYQVKEKSIESAEKLHILYLSNFIRLKGYRETLELALLAKQQKDNKLMFHFAGKFFEKEEEVFFFNYIKENELGDFVKYHGIVSGKDKCDLLKKCHVFTLLTRYPNEGQPISILEAMGNGMAIITTDHAGIPDIVENRINGVVVPKGDVDTARIFRVICDWESDRNELNKICKTNFDTASSKYTEENYITNMDFVFSKILNE